MALPGGEVTFCFTDIEGSTRLAQRLGDEQYRAVLETHRDLLRDVWAKHGGVEVSTEGDSFFVVFTATDDALEAAADAQRSIGTHDWPDDASVAVRIGLHRGVAEMTGNNYVGVEVHRASRVTNAAHGGQIVMSEVIARDLPPVRVSDLGPHRLKDFAEPVHIWQLNVDGLDQEFPALRAAPADAHNLPVLRTSFVGRDDELDALAKATRENQLVTVIGPGGAGKTRLVLELGRTASARYPDGVWAVFLAGTHDDARVADEVAAVLGVQEQPGGIVDAITRRLADAEMLLIFDNCEQVIDGVASLTDAILTAAPKVVVVATSRRPLQVRGEDVLALTTLSEEAATRLFVERAGAANPRFSLTAENAPHVDAICRGVDGLPLAIELAASTSRAVPLATLADRIDRPGSVLRDGNRADDARQRSIDELIGWSYDLLDEDQRNVFRRFSVFRGGATFDAAEAVCGDAGFLADLVDHSLLHLDDDGRYRMLVLVRGYAAERLRESADEEDAVLAHIRYFQEMGQRKELVSSTGAALFNVEAELDNSYAAFDAACARGLSLEAGQISTGLNELLVRRSRFGLSTELMQRVQRVAEEAGDEERIGFARCNLAQVAMFQGDIPTAIAQAEAAAASLRSANAMPQLGSALSILAASHTAVGQLDQARAAIDEGLAHDPAPAVRASLLMTLGNASHGGGDMAGAEAAFREAYEILTELCDGRAVSLKANVAIMAAQRGALDEADALLTEVVDQAESDQEHRVYVGALMNRATVRKNRGQLDDSLADSHRALATAELIGEPTLVAFCHDAIAQALVARGDVREAAEALRASLEVSVPINAAPCIAVAKSTAVTLATALGNEALAADIDAMAPTPDCYDAIKLLIASVISQD